MNQDELMELIRAGESETTEFKKNFDRETIETAGAFSNTKGGAILIGVSNKDKVVGDRQDAKDMHRSRAP